MTVSDSETVDAIGTRGDTGVVTLAIFDHLSWDDCHQHLVTLQAKINTYLGFIESGEILTVFPRASGRDVEIEVHFKFPPLPSAERFLKTAAEVSTDAGVGFSWEVSE